MAQFKRLRSNILSSEFKWIHDLIAISTLDNTDNFGRGLSLNDDGSRLVVGNSTGDGSGNAAAASGDVYLISFSDNSWP